MALSLAFLEMNINFYSEPHDLHYRNREEGALSIFEITIITLMLTLEVLVD